MDDEFRREFFAGVQRDPVRYMIVSIYADAWADGYEQALADADARGIVDRPGLADVRALFSHSDLRARAVDLAVEADRRGEAAKLLALAELARHHPPPPSA